MPTPVEEFNTASRFTAPDGYETWKLQNKYPKSGDQPPVDDKPWLGVDFKTPEGAKEYCNLVKEYFFYGNTEHNFRVEKNEKRKWYHPPWLHYGPKGREPINGLSFGGFLSPRYLAKSQNRWVQGWLCSYFNWEAATILGDMWAIPSNPKWNDHLRFPVGSVICENIFIDVEDDEVPIVKGSPEAYACIGELPKCPEYAEAPDKRMATATRLRLIQVDFAARDKRSPIGWVFGTFACDGRKPVLDPWDNVFPIGLQWGNDPGVLQKQYDQGQRPKELWKNHSQVDPILKELGGERPWLGWHDRLDGLADDFMGTCTSCHATAQLSKPGRPPTSRVQNLPPKEIDGKWVQLYEDVEKKWLRNLEHGTPFDDDSLSADYNIHVEFAFRNYRDWKERGGE